MGELTGTRRDVLRSTGAALGAATLASSAGCLGVLGGNEYAQWLPEPGTVGGPDHYSFSKFGYSALEEHEDEFGAETDFDVVEMAWAPADVDWEDVTMHLSFDGVNVVAAEFDREDVVDDFADEDVDEDGEHEGYTVLENSNESAAVAVGDGTFVTAGFGFGQLDDPVDAVEAVVDTREGEEDAYLEDSDAFDELTDELDDGDSVTGVTTEPTTTDDPAAGEFEHQVAQGRSWTVNGDETNGQWVLVFEEEDDVDIDDVEEWVTTSDDREFEDWDDFEYATNGRTAVVRAVADTDDL